jgi:hypothetical protein
VGVLSHEGKGMYCTLFHTIKFQMRWRLAVSGGGATRCAGKVPQCSPLLCFVPAVSLIISLSVSLLAFSGAHSLNLAHVSRRTPL